MGLLAGSWIAAGALVWTASPISCSSNIRWLQIAISYYHHLHHQISGQRQTYKKEHTCFKLSSLRENIESTQRAKRELCYGNWRKYTYITPLNTLCELDDSDIAKSGNLWIFFIIFFIVCIHLEQGMLTGPLLAWTNPYKGAVQYKISVRNSS